MRLLKGLRVGSKVRTANVKGAARGYLLALVAERTGAPIVCVTADETEADQLRCDLAFFLGGKGTLESPRILRIPADEVLPWDELSADHVTVTERLGALFQLRSGGTASALVLSHKALVRRVLPPAAMGDWSETVKAGTDVDRDTLARKLSDMGYQNAPLVEDPGTFSVRGDIVDVYSPLYEKPVRLELFGDTVESMRAFDPQTQRTVEPVSLLRIIPARELIVSSKTLPFAEAGLRDAADRVNLPSIKLRERLDSLRDAVNMMGMEPLLPTFYEGGLATVFDYLPHWRKGKAPIFYFDDPLSIDRNAHDFEKEIQAGYDAAMERQDLSAPISAHYLSREDIDKRAAQFAVIEGGGLALGEAKAQPVHFSFGSTKDLREALLSHHGEEGALTPLVDRLQRWRELSVAAAVATGSLSQADRIKRLLADRNISVRVHQEPLKDAAALFDPAVLLHLFTGEISAGFVDTGGGFALLSDEEIFGARSRRRSRKPKANPFAEGFRDLKEGDLVVHTDFGVARYAGLTKMEVRNVPGDFLVLEYAGKDKVYLPISRMRLIQKFSGGDPEKVALDKLGGQSWEKTKNRVKEQLLKMAAELLKLYAARKAHPGYAYSEPDRYFRQFEADFEFEETEDQSKAIEDVLRDMQKPEPMDRLVCGDVGYGKTEVAMRAAFKATLDRRQVAVLVPTTVLAQQHFLSFRRRFRDYPVTIESVSRMRSSEENREVLKKAKNGQVDVVIGTHKLLGADVSFKELGLIIVDEEQRFGVKQKEALKRLRTQVDVLTLTATPIPRTLNMAMSGIRDLSIIATPPQDRRAIRTFVVKYDAAVIKEAVERELLRGGQVFFVHNRVESIHTIEKELRALLPKVSIGVAHGQMGEGQLEKVMAGFIDKKFDVLLCTSIIESGIDIPSANTMIVNRADQFGLAQLYQLRGRVGRSKDRAYAYLMVPPERAVTKEAQRRLEVLQQFTELGAGFSIASHDMDIRGAGSLLGGEQSGAIEAIGFELYTQLLEEAVAELKGEEPRTVIEPEVSLPFPAFIPDDYVPDVHQRLVFYKRLSDAQTPEVLQDLRGELVDRYGELPEEVDNLCELMLLKIDMRDLRLRALDSTAGKIVVTLGAEALLDGHKLAALISRSKGVYRLTPDLKLVARVSEHLKGPQLIVESRKVLGDLGRCAAPSS